MTGATQTQEKKKPGSISSMPPRLSEFERKMASSISDEKSAESKEISGAQFMIKVVQNSEPIN